MPVDSVTVLVFIEKLGAYVARLAMRLMPDAGCGCIAVKVQCTVAQRYFTLTPPPPFLNFFVEIL